MKKFSAHLDLTKAYWKKQLKIGDVAIDATCGNGHDTLFLAQRSILFGLDIQPEAIDTTGDLLKKHGLLDRVTLLCMSHEHLQNLNLPKAPKLIVYNLGYLPGKNKQLTTQTETTLASLKSGLAILSRDGAISVTCYPGHEEGEREEKAVLTWAESLDLKEWTVCYHRWLNRPKSPTVLWVTKNLASSMI